MSGDADGRTASSFMRGLTIGAILGAIIAGSSIWSRRRHRPPASTADRPTGARPT
ncbi:MAG: hypothetical protein ABJC39_03400 [Chloroflexota bacterium]